MGNRLDGAERKRGRQIGGMDNRNSRSFRARMTTRAQADHLLLVNYFLRTYANPSDKSEFEQSEGSYSRMVPEIKFGRQSPFLDKLN